MLCWRLCVSLSMQDESWLTAVAVVAGIGFSILVFFPHVSLCVAHTQVLSLYRLAVLAGIGSMPLACRCDAAWPPWL